MPTSPKALVTAWVDAFNRKDVEALAAMYAEDAVNHQVAEAPVAGRAAIRAMFAAGFAAADCGACRACLTAAAAGGLAVAAGRPSRAEGTTKGGRSSAPARPHRANRAMDRKLNCVRGFIRGAEPAGAPTIV